MKFDLFVINKFGSKVYITQFDPNQEQHNLYSTYNEKISLSDNDQVTLTFSLMRKIPDPKGHMVINPYLKYLVFGAKVCIENDRNLYELIITQIAPNSSKNNTVYNFTCQDEMSYKWSRMQLGYSYSTTERGGVRTLYQIAQDILKDCKLDTKWTVQPVNSRIYPNENLSQEKITLEVEGSNPYNVLIEGLNTLNASMLVNYRNHEIRFYQKDKVLFSGYRYRPETSLRSLSATFNIDELATLLHVVGGTDERDINITLVPPIPDAVQNYITTNDFNGNFLEMLDDSRFAYVTPEGDTELEKEIHAQEVSDVKEFCVIADRVRSLGQFLYNFDFFVQNGLMTQQQYNDIVNIFDVQMRNINIKLKPLLITYYNLLWDLNKVSFDISAILEQINAAFMGLIKEYRKNQEDLDENVISGFVDDIQLFLTEYNNKLSDYMYKYINIYGNTTNLLDQNRVPEVQELIDQFNLQVKIRDESRYYYYHYQKIYFTNYSEYFDVTQNIESAEQDSDYNYDKAELQSNIIYYYDKFYMALQLCGVKNDISYGQNYYYDVEYLSMDNEQKQLDDIKGNASHIATSSLNKLYNDIVTNTAGTNTYGLYNSIMSLEKEIQDLWEVVYSKYSSFIYEATYENTDELDSLSLYNQAISYFENYHHPKSSYSVEILNLDDLEQIGTPNLKVNSRIRIYNEDLGLDEGTSYVDGDPNTKLNNISYTNNELLITALNYDLRKSAAVSITVERIIQHQTILQKLIKSIK